MAQLSTKALINDARWAFVDPLLPLQRSSPPPNGRMDTRRVFAAVVYAVTTDTAWDDIPDKFGGITPTTAQRRFWKWTDADVWRKLAAAAIGTPHERWAQTVADHAIRRAGQRAPGYLNSEPVTERAADEPHPGTEPAGTELVDRAPAAQRRYPRYSVDEYATARAALNRHDGNAL